MLITNGGKQAVYQAFATLLDPGDEVLLPAPYWTTYPEAIALAGGVTVPVPTDETTGYLATVAALEAARTPRTKVLLFCSPSNPTGAVYPPEQVEAIGRWAVEHGIWVVTDEIYEHLVYGDAQHVSMPVAVPELADRCIVVNGVAKTYAMTGWRVGWMIGAARRDQGGGEPAVAPDQQRRERLPARGAGRGQRRPERGARDARGVRPAAADDRADAARGARGSSARSRSARSTPTRPRAGCSARSCAAAPRPRPLSWPS